MWNLDKLVNVFKLPSIFLIANNQIYVKKSQYYNWVSSLEIYFPRWVGGVGLRDKVTLKRTYLEWSWYLHPLNFPVLLSLSLNIHEIHPSLWVSVSTSKNFSVLVSYIQEIYFLNESWSWHPTYIPVSMSLSLDIHITSRWVIKPNKRNITQLR